MRKHLPLLLSGASILFTMAAYAQSSSNDAVCPNVARRGVTARASVVASELDFDGDGISDIVFSKSSEDHTDFSILRSSDGTSTSIQLGAGKPVPADYDGDGLVDAAVVRLHGGKYIWEVKRSSDGQVQSQTFGESEDTLVYGCHTLRKEFAALTILRGKKILTTQLGDSTASTLGSINLGEGELLGCGDVGGDGIDDLLFLTPSKIAGLNAISTVGCGNQLLTYRTIKPFRNGGVIALGPLDFPLFTALRPVSGGKVAVSLQAVSEIFPYPKFFVPGDVIFSSGIFRISSDDTSYGLLWQDPHTGSVKRRLFDVLPPKAEEVAVAPDGFRLVRPQAVYK